MIFLLKIVITILVASAVFGIMMQVQKRRQALAEARFKRLMESLDEKAKRDPR